MARAEAPSLRRHVDRAPADQFFFDRAARARVADLARATSLGGGLAELAGRSVLVATSSQLTSALALIELDGVARRITILPPDADRAHLRALIADAECDAAVIDEERNEASFDLAVCIVCSPNVVPTEQGPPAFVRTEWVLLTSGTTGVPKMVVHSLAGLSAAITAQTDSQPVVWGTFYDIRRYGGLQIFLRAVLSGASLVLSSAGEPVAEHLCAARAAWRDAPVGHAVALAPRADVARDRQNLAALRSPLRRDRRSGDPRQFARGFSAGRHRPRLRLDRSRRRLRRQRRPRRIPGWITSTAFATALR